jgi:diacylglycerol kinase (ATP)
MLRTQPNFRIEAAIGAGAVALAVWLRFDATEWATLAMVIALVLILEGLNTALELVVDLASPAAHPKAKAAKDIAAATVLIAAVASLVVGALLFGRRLVALLD